MKGNKFVVSASAAVLAVVSGIALAGPISDTYTEVAPQQPLDGTTMNSNLTNLKNAVNGIADNTLNSTLKTEVDKIGGVVNTSAVLNATCNGNNAVDVMVRVGPICVDKYPASLYNGTADTASAATIGSCAPDGKGASCANIYAQSRQGATPAAGTSVSWAQAARVCANAGKRLLTPAEWINAWQKTGAGANDIAGITACTSCNEYVDGMANPAAPGVAPVGFIGESFDIGGGILALEYSTNIVYTQTDAGWVNTHFRCAR